MKKIILKVWISYPRKSVFFVIFDGLCPKQIYLSSRNFPSAVDNTTPLSITPAHVWGLCFIPSTLATSKPSPSHDTYLFSIFKIPLSSPSLQCNPLLYLSHVSHFDYCSLSSSFLASRVHKGIQINVLPNKHVFLAWKFDHLFSFLFPHPFLSFTVGISPKSCQHLPSSV